MGRQDGDGKAGGREVVRRRMEKKERETVRKRMERKDEKGSEKDDYFNKFPPTMPSRTTEGIVGGNLLK